MIAMRFPFSLLFLLILVSACAPPADEATEPSRPELEFHSGANAALNLPFSDAVRVGNLLYLSGQVGNPPGVFEVVEGGTMAEARQTLTNIKRVLEENGSSMDHVVKCTLMLEDMSEWSAVNEVYVEFFPNDKPARSAFGTSGLALGAAVEIECIGYVP